MILKIVYFTKKFKWTINIKNTKKLNLFSKQSNGNPLQYSCLENPMDGEAW